MLGLLVDSRQEDDRDTLRLFALADDLRGFVAVQPGHVDVEQDHCELALQEVTERLLAGAGQYDLAEILKHRRHRKQVALVIVDEEYPRPFRLAFRRCRRGLTRRHLSR